MSGLRSGEAPPDPDLAPVDIEKALVAAHRLIDIAFRKLDANGEKIRPNFRIPREVNDDDAIIIRAIKELERRRSEAAQTATPTPCAADQPDPGDTCPNPGARVCGCCFRWRQHEDLKASRAARSSCATCGAVDDKDLVDLVLAFVAVQEDLFDGFYEKEDLLLVPPKWKRAYVEMHERAQHLCKSAPFTRPAQEKKP